MTIKANTCPHCGGPYTLNAPCQCDAMKAQNRLVSLAAEGDPGETAEPVYREPVFYVPGQATIIDACINGRGQYSGETLEEIRQRYPGAEIGEWGTVYRNAQEQFKSGPVEITEARFWEMLEILPPVAWINGAGNTESFKMSERTYGSITTIFCRIGKRYFELSDSIATPHAEIVRRCAEFAKGATC